MKIIEESFGLRINGMHREGGGWASTGMCLHTQKGAFFLKVFDKRRAVTPRLVQTVTSVVPALEGFVEQHDFQRQVPLPLKTLNGDLSIEDADHVYMLYPYVSGGCLGGTPLSKAQVQQLATIVGNLHTCGTANPGANLLAMEDFRPWFLPPLRRQLDMTANIADPELREWLCSSKTAVLAFARELQVSGENLREERPTLGFCHTDLHPWNWMQRQGQLVIIDWEGLRLAPAEADLMSFAEGPYWRDFISEYRRVRPEFVIDANRLRYYQVRRKLEDIWEFIEQILYESPTIEQRREIMRSIKKEFSGLIRYQR